MTARAWSWAAVSMALYVVAFIGVAVAVVLPLQYLELIPHSASLAVWAATWVVLSGLAVLLSGRLLFHLELRATSAAWLILAAGALLNAWLLISLFDWTTLRGGGDWDFLGPTGWLEMVVAGTATAGFGVLIAPREVAPPAVLGVLVGASLTALVVVFNVPGALDGIPPESWALAAAIGTSLVYAVGLAVVSVRKLRTGRTPGQ